MKTLICEQTKRTEFYCSKLNHNAPVIFIDHWDFIPPSDCIDMAEPIPAPWYRAQADGTWLEDLELKAEIEAMQVNE